MNDFEAVKTVLLEWPAHQREALVMYASQQDMSLSEAVQKLTAEALAIDAMCPEIAQDSNLEKRCAVSESCPCPAQDAMMGCPTG